MMKTLITIALLQTGILLVILFRLPGDAPERVETRPPAASSEASTANPFARQQPTRSNTPAIDEDRLRAVVREELQRALAELENGGDSARDSGVSIVSTPPVNPEQRDRVLEQIEYYRSVGEISPRDMNELMSEIAQLDAQARQHAMSRLTQAMNRQEIDGRF